MTFFSTNQIQTSISGYFKLCLLILSLCSASTSSSASASTSESMSESTLENKSESTSKKISLITEKQLPASNETNITTLVNDYFEHLIINIDSTLFNEQDQLKNNPVKLAHFVNQQILPIWDVEKTLKGLVGSKNWKSFTADEISMLKNIFNETMQRYVSEGMTYYSGQRIDIVKVQINAEKKRGMLTIALKTSYLPAFNINFRLIETNAQWLIYDVLVQGISYVKTKRAEYRRKIKNEGVLALVESLNKKNRVKQNKLEPSLNSNSNSN